MRCGLTTQPTPAAPTRRDRHLPRSARSPWSWQRQMVERPTGSPCVARRRSGPALRARHRHRHRGDLGRQCLPALTPLHPKARHAGLRTATVVDAQGSPEPRDAAVHGDALGRIRVRFDEQGRLPAADSHALSSIWVRVAQVWASSGVGGSVGAQFMPRLGQQVLVDFINGDPEQPVVVGAVYDGRGEGALAATPGGEAGEVDRSVFGMSGDHRPSAQGNLVGGHAPAWHGASPEGLDQEGQRNAAALSGFKSQEWDGGVGGVPGFSQLVLDDSDSQLRVQLATTAHSSQLNLGHLIHQADNHRGGFRGTGFELRTDAYASLRAGNGLLLSTAPSRAQEPAGDNAAGLALGKQLQQLTSTFSQAAGTHQVPTLAAALGSAKANASAQSDTEAPAQALLTALKGLVDGKVLDGALSDAAARNTAGNKLPHTVSPVVAIQAQGGLIEVAGQDHVQAAGHTVLEAAGQALEQAVAGDWRLHTGQAIGLLGGVIKPGSGSAGTGLTAIAASKEVQVQAQSDTLTLAAQKDVTVGSQSAHVDWAAAKSITLAVSGGASITIEGGRIEVKAPGTITVKAGKKSLVGGGKASFSMPKLPRVPLVPVVGRLDLRLLDMPGEGGVALAHAPWSVLLLRQGQVFEKTLFSGTSDAQGRMVLSNAEQQSLVDQCSARPNDVWVDVLGDLRPLWLEREATDWTSERKAGSALAALDYSEDVQLGLGAETKRDETVVQVDKGNSAHSLWADIKKI
jgi:type VI secretion system secreted protein VgrG